MPLKLWLGLLAPAVNLR